MKKLFYIFTAVVALSVVSCAVKEESSYVPAEPESGAQYYFDKATPSKYIITPDTESFEIKVLRGNKEQASTAIIEVTDTSKTVFAEGVKEISVAFAAGESESALVLPIVYENYSFGDLYGLTLNIKEETTQYAPSCFNIEISLPEPWKSLGNATLYDEWFLNWFDVEDIYPKGITVEVPLEQNELTPNVFRLLDPYGLLMSALDYSDANAEETQEYVQFEILKPGTNLGDDEDPLIITQEGLVYYKPICTGFYDSGNGGTHYYLHPSNFSSTFSEEGISHNYVQQWQEGEDALPAIVVLSPFPYMYGVGGWNRSTKEEITIVFPGVVVKDYSVDVEYGGLLSAADGDYAYVNVTLGEDLAEAVIAIAPGEDPYDALALILDEDESVITVTKSGEVKIPLPEEVAEAYSIVIAPVVDGEVLADEAAYDTFAYKDFSISVAASEPVINDDEVSGTTTVSFVFGADVEYAKLALFEGKSSDLTEEDLAIFDDEDSEEVIIVKHADDTFDVVLPEEGDYTLVAVSYAFEQAWNISVRDIEFVLVNPWETVGTATWTDAFFGPWFSADALSYDIELQANNEVPGFYRLVNVYGEAFLYNEEGDWDDSKDYYLKLHAEDPDAVWFETFDTGCDWGYGDFLLASDMGLYIEEYGLEAVLEAVDAGDIDNTFGNLSNNVITFPVDGVLKAMAGYNGGAWYYGNHAAVFTITLNFDASASGIQKKHASRSLGMAQKASRNLSAVSIARGRLSSKNISKEAPVISTL